LQSFPDDYWFSGSWTERMRQVGNAVPVKLARIVAESVGAAVKAR
jgi:DNA (cytosine-5)-methyltransferase 1